MALSRITSTLVLSLALVFTGCATGLQQAATPESVGFSSERLKTMAAAVQDGVDKSEVPGAVVLLARRGKIAYFQSFGLRDPEAQAPMTSDVIFRMASMTKPITTTAAMMLVDEGRLNLSDPVSRYLPEFKSLVVGVETKDAAGNTSLALESALREMTILDLMRHTSGLTYGFTGKSLVKDRYNAAKATDPEQSNAEMVARLARLPLQNQPGTIWDYSKLMTRDQLPAGIPTNGVKLPVIDVRQEAGNGFGLGFMVRTAEGRNAIRGSVGDYTWNGLFGTYFWIDPKQELFGIILLQTPAPAFVRSAGYWVRIRNLAYEALVN